LVTQDEHSASQDKEASPLDLGAFSVSLAVADLPRSMDFYRKLGFAPTGGSPEEGWVILANGTTLLGLFTGMFEGHILTFNPGLTNTQLLLAEFTDVRDIQAELVARGVELTESADTSGDGPAHLALLDPDGNSILIDQHVPRPAESP
jgi:catechol 2,3-dioxygenase-like lactoylglutathione lyase family enzyme